MPPKMAKEPTRVPEALRETHNRAVFKSGNDLLDVYLKQRASQDARRGIARPYVIPDDDGNVIAYYTLTSTSIEITDLPDPLPKKLPRHGVLGATLLGRLAVDQKYHRLGYGALMVAHASEQAFNSNPAGSLALIVAAIDDAAVRFYLKLGFIPFPDTKKILFLPRESLKKYLR